MKIKPVFIYTFLIIFILSIFYPLYEYVNIVGLPKGNIKSDWANFGDFFGGTLNTIISFFSLIILGYLTYIMTKNSNEENKKTNLLIKRLESYNILSQKLPELLQVFHEMTEITSYLNHYFTNENTNNYDEQLKIFANKCLIFSELFSIVVTFNLLHGHLFKYNFNSKEYNLLIDHTNQMKQIYTTISSDLIQRKKQSSRINMELINQFNSNFNSILKTLQKELI